MTLLPLLVGGATARQVATVPELPQLKIAISVRTPPEVLPVADREVLRSAVLPHQDGLWVAAGAHCATFLPKVREQLPDVDDFLDALGEKASLRQGTWPSAIRIQRYSPTDSAEA